MENPSDRNTTYQVHKGMEKFTPEYFMKNIMFPGKHQFLLSLIEKIVEFIKRMWWKNHIYLNPSDPSWELRPGKKKMKPQKTPPSNHKLDHLWMTCSD